MFSLIEYICAVCGLLARGSAIDSTISYDIKKVIYKIKGFNCQMKIEQTSISLIIKDFVTMECNCYPFVPVNLQRMEQTRAIYDPRIHLRL